MLVILHIICPTHILHTFTFFKQHFFKKKRRIKMIVTFLFSVLSGGIKKIAPFMVRRTAGPIDRIDFLTEARFLMIGAILSGSRGQ